MILQVLASLATLSAPPADTGLTLTGTQWQLIEFVSFKYDTTRLLECHITLQFNKGRYEGRYGPNAYAGTFQIEGKGRIHMNLPACTKNPLPASCRFGDSAEDDSLLFQIILFSTTRFDILDNKLYLKGSDGQINFIFRKAE